LVHVWFNGETMVPIEYILFNYELELKHKFAQMEDFRLESLIFKDKESYIAYFYNSILQMLKITNTRMPLGRNAYFKYSEKTFDFSSKNSWEVLFQIYKTEFEI